MTKHVVLTIEGMTCNGCVAAVRNVLSRQAGVRSTKVEVGKVEIELDEGSPDGNLDAICAAVEKAGYTVKDPPRPR